MRKYLTLLSVFAVGACSESTTPPAFDVVSARSFVRQTFKETTPVDEFVLNPCNGQYVLITGTRESIFIVSSKPNGRTDVDTDIRTRGTGVAYPEGTQYTYDSKSSASFASSDPLPLNTSTSENVKLNARGSDRGSDFTMTFRVTYHINSQGTPTQDRVVDTTSCK